MPKMIHKIRIHGDNILECETTLKLMSSALNGGSYDLIAGPAYAPVYKFSSISGEVFEAQLFGGYGRWNFPLVEYIASLGGTLREAPDAVITRVEMNQGQEYERPILALEFSGALPAGNNAWQRTGRALALAYAGIPYLYFAELGGQELDSERTIKAARFPNPLVPFAYAVLGANSNSMSLPIYVPSPSSNQSIIEIFDGCFGTKESIEIVRGILLSEDTKGFVQIIEGKVLKILEILSQQRKRDGILRAGEWAELLLRKTGLEKIEWLIKRAMPWNKKTGIKTLTSSFPKLINAANKSGAVAIGSKDMPICIIPDNNRKLFAEEVKKIHEGKVSDEFIKWLLSSNRPLLCVWVAGFKPKGDDSRPDRGLIPLARMIFGIEDVDLLTIIYGPAKEAAWKLLEGDMQKLASTNGLWEAVISLSNGILIDSSTSGNLKTRGFVIEKSKKSFEKKLLPAASVIPKFGEHDVDAVLHLLFSNKLNDFGVYESLCNPPGGDWSGVNIFERQSKYEFRWTSLPRVSGDDSKRPDHLIQFLENNVLFSVESKDTESKLEEGIGPRLVEYAKVLLASKPIAFRKYGQESWNRFSGEKIKIPDLLSGAAFRYQNDIELSTALKKGKVDIVFGIELKPGKTKIHILSNKNGVIIVDHIIKLSKQLENLIELEIH